MDGDKVRRWIYQYYYYLDKRSPLRPFVSHPQSRSEDCATDAVSFTLSVQRISHLRYIPQHLVSLSHCYILNKSDTNQFRSGERLLQRTFLIPVLMFYSRLEMASTSQAELATPIQSETASPSKSETMTSVQVIHIPANGSPLLNPKLAITQLDHQGLNGNLRNETQERLQRVPNLEKYIEQGLFEWDHRGLFELDVPKNRVPEGSKGWEGCYIMYKCNTSESKLPFNRHFVGSLDARVFGDAFLFKLNGPECDQSGKATLHDLGSEFLERMNTGGFAIEILSTMSKI